MTMELLQLHIGNLSGKYLATFHDFNSSTQLYKNYGNGMII